MPTSATTGQSEPTILGGGVGVVEACPLRENQKAGQACRQESCPLPPQVLWRGSTEKGL